MEESTFKFPNLCQYRDVLGKPNEGIRQKLRLFDISIIDVLLTIVLGLLLARIFAITKFNGILLSFLLGLVFHKIFCVKTKVSKLLNDKFDFL
jgi:hypothetical protein